MKPEEKNTLLQFMGQVYGETKKRDQMVVGQSTNLQPRSEEVKREFEKVLRTTPTDSIGSQQPMQQPMQQPQVETAPVQSAIVTPEQAAAELAQTAQSQVLSQPATTVPIENEQVVDPNQMEFDLSEPSKVDRVIELLETNNKLLVEIRNNSIKSKYNAKRAKNQKPQ